MLNGILIRDSVFCLIEEMQIIVILVGIIGVGITLMGIKMLVGISNLNIIAELKLSENEHEISIEKAGLYSVCFVGGLYVRNIGSFEAKVTSNGHELEVIEQLAKFKFHHNGKTATEFYQFEVTRTGIHQLSFSGTDDLEVKNSQLKLINLLQSKWAIENIGIIVKESTSGSFIIGLLLSLMGLVLMGFGLLLAFNSPDMKGIMRIFTSLGFF